MSDSIILRARWVFPIDQPPIRDGIVEISAGRIQRISSYQAAENAIDLGDVALLPGLINAHTHLEFSDLKKPLGQCGNSFSHWIGSVIRYRQEQMQASREPDAWRERAIVRGLAESQQAGIAMVGEIVTPPCPEKIYSTSSPQSTLFLELLGLAPERMEPLWNLAVEHIASGKKALNVGLSPHAPYTVHPELLARVCRLSQQHQFPIAMHLAETIEELELLQSASGALATFLNNLGAWSSNMLPRGLKPLDYLEQLAQAHAALVVHGNYLSAQEIEFLGTRSAHMSVVYCPRTHAYFHAGDYPLADMLAANVNVCLGTDSRASNPNLALWEEMQWIAQRHPRVSLEGVLHLGTLSGAEALHCDDRFGSITPGKQAVFCAVELLVNDGRDPHEILFSQQTKVHRLYYDA